MGFYAITALINAIVGSLIGPFVYFKNPKGAANRIFALVCLNVAIWSYSYFFWQISTTETAALFWSRALMIGAIFIPISYLHFILELLGKIQKKKKLLIFGYLVFFFFFLVNFTSLFIEGVSPKLNFNFWPNVGILYSPFLLLWFFYAFYAIFLLLKEYPISLGVKKSQIRYVLIGTIIGYLGGATNYFLWYDIPIPPIGNWTTALYLGIVTYAIVKYRFMDIRFALGRGAVYAFSFINIIALAFFLMFLNNQFFSAVSFNITGSLILIISILLFQPVFRFFEKLASKYFYYTFYNYQKVLIDLGRGLARVLDLDKLSSLIVKTLMETMKLDRTIILLKGAETKEYRIQKNIGFREENGISLVKDNFLTLWLEKTQNPLVYEELSLIIKDTIQKEEKRKLEKLKSNMKSIEAALCLPLFAEEKIKGMIVLGKKISGDPYSEQDINLLAALSNQASIAFQNAKLYSEVEDLSKNLEKKVKEQTKDLQKAYEELKVLDKAKSEFISMASHQLRTPLTAIKGYISMLLEGSYGDLPEESKEKMKNVFISNERLIKIVNDLLNISKIELGKMDIEKKPIQVEETIDSVYQEMKPQAEKKNLKLVWQRPEKLLPRVEADELKIRQVVSNLIDNALRYTREGEIEIKSKKTNSAIQISIRDTGEGLTKKEEKWIFEGFTRGKVGIARWIEGAGLGLYVAKKYIELHQGKIWAVSPGKGKGSAFYVELPIK